MLDKLLPFTLHPRSWGAWVPRQLLEEHVYDQTTPIAVGHNTNTGWFILIKDPEPRILYIEREVEPTAFNNPAHDPEIWGEVGRPEGLPKLDGMVCNRGIMQTVFKITDEEALFQKIGNRCIIQAQNLQIAYTRIHPNLYRIYKVQKLLPSPPPSRTA